MDQLLIQWLFSLTVGIVFCCALYQQRSRYASAAVVSLVIAILLSSLLMPAYGG